MVGGRLVEVYYPYDCQNEEELALLSECPVLPDDGVELREEAKCRLFS